MVYIIGDGTGQLCNKLIFIANLLASAKEHDFFVTYYNFPILNGLECEDKDLERYINRSKKIGKINIKLLKRLFFIFDKIPILKSYIFLNKNSKDLLASNSYFKLWLGWPYFDLISLKKNQNFIRNYFRETILVDEIASDFLENNNFLDNKKKLVAIHIRRGDYKEWFEGKYYFTDFIYRKYMDKCYKLFKEDVNFILFSNEAINEENFRSNSYEVIFARNSAVIDLIIMSRCSYIMGPPSTYSGWASFYGNVPRFLIEEEESDMQKSFFKVWLTESSDWTC